MHYHRFIKQIGERVIPFIFPATCSLCKKPGHNAIDLCAECLAALPKMVDACLQCGTPMALADATQQRCGKCLATPPPYDHIHALFRYEDGIQRLIVNTKFYGKLAHTRLLGQLLALSKTGEHNIDMLIAVPSNPSTLRKRGYNQAVEIAKEVSKRLQIPLATSACWKTRHTQKQAGLDAIDRQFNLLGAFNADEKIVSQRRIAVIDDVMTTGSTLSEVADTLKKAGAEWVEGWVCARVL